MHRKSVGVLGAFLGSYGAFLLLPGCVSAAATCGVVVGLAMAAVGFCIQHDANHGAYSERRIVNRAMGALLDLLGASSYVWRFKHNVLHHGHPNVAGYDDDVGGGIVARFAVAQPWRPVHAYQHLYLWPLYALISFKWQVLDDWCGIARGRFAGRSFARPRGWEAGLLMGGKVLGPVWALLLPLCVQPLGPALVFFASLHATTGLISATTFQLAHCVEPAHRDSAPEAAKRDWARHQVESTVNFCRANRLLGWYLGGLNFQIEHHLFPNVCHVHYPAISHLVQSACRDHGVRYTEHATLRAALTSHCRWLRAMGRGP